MTKVLNTITVIDNSNSVAGAYAARLLAAHGARVINIEPPTGSPLRHLVPIDQQNGESGLAAWLNAGKQSIVLDSAHDRDRQQFDLLCQQAQVLIHDGWRPTASTGDNLTQCRISWFGEGGPYQDYQATDALVMAMCGIAFGMGNPGEKPTLPTGYGPQILAGVTAVIAILASLIRHPASADNIDTSILESSMILTEIGALARDYGQPTHRGRFGVNRYRPTYPMGVYACEDGWVGITALTPSQWLSLCELLDLADLANDKALLIAIERFNQADRIDQALRQRLLSFRARPLVEAGQARRIPLALVPTPAELLEMKEFRERNAFSKIQTGSGRSFFAPGIPFRLTEIPANGDGRPPQLAEHQSLLEKLSTDTMSNKQGTLDSLPLKGVRIIDLSMGWAGPLATRFLADLGADVIKIEACQYPDWWRGWESTQQWLDNKLYEKAPAFNATNRNKKGITLDLTRAEGREILFKLIKDADALIENNTATVLPKLGLSYEVLKSHNEQLVMLSMPAFGWHSPWSHFRAYGSTVEQASGLPHLNGEADWPPTQMHVALGDAIAGINAAAALLMAIYQKKQTQIDQFIDFSQVEALLPLLAHGLISQSLNETPAKRMGSRRENFAPYGVYPCRDQESWIAITIESEEQWLALATLIEYPLDPPLDINARIAQADQIDEAISQWSCLLVEAQAMLRLQQAGIAAAIVRPTWQTPDDPQLAARGFFQQAKGVHRERALYPSAAFNFNGIRPKVLMPAPKLGEHNEIVLKHYAGLSDVEIDTLRQQNIIGNIPIVKINA